jgi:hypothetical protein
MGIQVISNGGGSGPIAYLKLLGDAALTSSLLSVVDQANNVSALRLATKNAQIFANRSELTGSFNILQSGGNIAPATNGNGNFNVNEILYTIYAGGIQTGKVNGIFLQATELSLAGLTHNLMDLQVNGVSKFSVTNGGAFGLPIKLEGITSSFPMIKRNGAAIDFRLADDSGFCPITASTVIAAGGGQIGGASAGVALGWVYVGAEIANNGFYGWSSTSSIVGIMDTNLTRISAGLIGVGTGTTSNVLGGLSLSRLIAEKLPTTRPATIGEFYQDTAANVLANGDLIIGIRQ